MRNEFDTPMAPIATLTATVSHEVFIVILGAVLVCAAVLVTISIIKGVQVLRERPPYRVVLFTLGIMGLVLLLAILSGWIAFSEVNRALALP
jgi:fructose-specific phosphotransferase system IIC component